MSECATTIDSESGDQRPSREQQFIQRPNSSSQSLTHSSLISTLFHTCFSSAWSTTCESAESSLVSTSNVTRVTDACDLRADSSITNCTDRMSHRLTRPTTQEPMQAHTTDLSSQHRELAVQQLHSERSLRCAQVSPVMGGGGGLPLRGTGTRRLLRRREL